MEQTQTHEQKLAAAKAWLGERWVLHPHYRGQHNYFKNTVVDRVTAERVRNER